MKIIVEGKLLSLKNEGNEIFVGVVDGA